MDDRSREYLAWVKADQEQAELEHRRVNRVRDEALALLRGLTRNWGPGADMANDPQERKTAAMLLIWCGAASARFDTSLLSDAAPLRAQATVRGHWTHAHIIHETRSASTPGWAG